MVYRILGAEGSIAESIPHEGPGESQEGAQVNAEHNAGPV